MISEFSTNAAGKDPSRRSSRGRGCPFCHEAELSIDYKDPSTLRYFITDRGKLIPRRVSGLCAKHQRELTTAVKRARDIALLPFTGR